MAFRPYPNPKDQTPNQSIINFKNTEMKYILAMLLATAGVMLVTALSISLLVHAHAIAAAIVFFGGFYLLRRAFRKYMNP
jgi:hypothetical protein